MWWINSNEYHPPEVPEDHIGFDVILSGQYTPYIVLPSGGSGSFPRAIGKQRVMRIIISTTWSPSGTIYNMKMVRFASESNMIEKLGSSTGTRAVMPATAGDDEEQPMLFHLFWVIDNAPRT